MAAGISIGAGITVGGGISIGNAGASTLMLNLDGALYGGTGPWVDTVSGKPFVLYNGVTHGNEGGGSFNFDPNADQYAQSATSLGQDLNTWSVVAWNFYTGTKSGASHPCIVSEVYPGATGQINYTLGRLVDSTANSIQSGFFGSGWQSTPSVPIAPGAWYQFAATFDGITNNLYINNVLVVSSVAAGVAPISSQGGINIMGRWDAPALADYWGGKLAMVKIHAGSIGAEGVDADWTANKARFGL